MRMINYALLAGAALFAATAANATTTITFDDGIGNLQPGEVSYANFNTPGTSGTIVGPSLNYAILTGSGPQGAQPATGDQGDPYLSVGTFLPSGYVRFDFTGQAGGGVRQLGMDYGSADSYNTFVLYLSNGLTETYTGGAAISDLANGNQTSPVTNGRLTFRESPGLYITAIELRSTGQALEVDNFGVIAAVPEPATWGMMLLGFGVMGVSLRRRRRSLPTLAQAV